MPMMIDLGETEARVSEKGGTITRLTHQNKPILATQFDNGDGRLRGGCHVCAPWFGSSEFSDRKHGYIRDITGDGVPHRNAAHVHIQQEVQEDYPWVLEYNAETIIHTPGLVEARLGVRRLNDGNKDLAPVNLGFHPYFACRNANDVVVSVNGHNQNLLGVSDRARAIEVTEPRQITLGIMPDRFIELHLGSAFLRHALSYLYLWTDSPGAYICVEPVLGNPELFNTRQGLFLDIGQELEVSMALEIKPTNY